MPGQLLFLYLPKKGDHFNSLLKYHLLAFPPDQEKLMPISYEYIHQSWCVNTFELTAFTFITHHRKISTFASCLPSPNYFWKESINLENKLLKTESMICIWKKDEPIKNFRTKAATYFKKVSNFKTF